MNGKLMFTLALAVFILACSSKQEETYGQIESQLYAEIPDMLPTMVVVDIDPLDPDPSNFPHHFIGLPKQYGVKFKTAVPLSITFAKGNVRHYLQMPDGKIYKVESNGFGYLVLSVKLPNGRIVPVQFSDVYGSNANAHPVEEVQDFGLDHGDAVFYIQYKEGKFDIHSCRPGDYYGHNNSVLQYREACVNGFRLGRIQLATAEKAAVQIIYEPPTGGWDK